jgi:hypothetical protein
MLKQIAIINGRPIMGIEPVITDSGIEYPNLFYCSYNGTLYFKKRDPKLISVINKMSNDIISELLESHNEDSDIEILGEVWAVTIKIDYDVIKNNYESYEYNGSLDDDYEFGGIHNVKLVDIILENKDGECL